MNVHIDQQRILDETFHSIDEWQLKTFGTRDLGTSTVYEKLKEEWDELAAKVEKGKASGFTPEDRLRIAEEAIDLAIVSSAVARAAGHDPQDLLNRKMEINRKRTWARQANGTFHHVTGQKEIGQFLAKCRGENHDGCDGSHCGRCSGTGVVGLTDEQIVEIRRAGLSVQEYLKRHPGPILPTDFSTPV